MRLIKMKVDDLARFSEEGSPSSGRKLPEGYSFRMYTPGDEKEWVRIQDSADDYIAVDEILFEREFGSNKEELPRRMVFLMFGEEYVGTAAAWLDDVYREPGTGRLHWVAIVPEHQGKGLALPLVNYTMSLFPGLGCVRGYLLTNAVRFPAVSLYLKEGFKPEIRDSEEAEIWEHIMEHVRIDGSLT